MLEPSGPNFAPYPNAILVTDKGVRYYAAVHLKAPAGTTMEKRDTILQQAIEVVYAHLQSR